MTGTILLTSLLWASSHAQYDFYEIGLVFVFGIVLGVARYRTRSLIVPIAMHGAMNLIVTIVAVIVLQSRG